MVVCVAVAAMAVCRFYCLCRHFRCRRRGGCCCCCCCCRYCCSCRCWHWYGCCYKLLFAHQVTLASMVVEHETSQVQTLKSMIVNHGITLVHGYKSFPQGAPTKLIPEGSDTWIRVLIFSHNKVSSFFLRREGWQRQFGCTVCFSPPCPQLVNLPTFCCEGRFLGVFLARVRQNQC